MSQANEHSITKAEPVSRRRFLRTSAALAAVPVAAIPAVAIASEGDDAELFALERELDEAVAEYRVASDLHDEAEERLAARWPEWPERLPLPEGFEDKYQGMTVRDLDLLEQEMPGHPLVLWARRDAVVNGPKWDACHAERKRLSKECGVDAAYEAQSAAMDKCWRISSEILAIPASTLAGVLVKVRVREKWLDYDEGAVEVQASLAADVERMAGCGNA